MEKAFPIEKHSVFSGLTFENPWPEWHFPAPLNVLKRSIRREEGVNLITRKRPPDKDELECKLPVVNYETKADFEILRRGVTEGIRAVWVGHATVFIQFPGFNIITDPIFAKRCAPLPLSHFSRFRPPPFTIQELFDNDVPLHAVIISHNHYDHLDSFSVSLINNLYGTSVCWYCPLGLMRFFLAAGCQKIVELTWWDFATISGSAPPSKDSLDGSETKSVLRLTCVPSQHWSGRGVLDKNKALWCGWVLQFEPNGASFYFAGDTGYNPSLFKQIGLHFGPLTLAAIPIGAYIPRYFLAPQHVDPTEAVLVHKDVRAKKSIGIHWGTFLLGWEAPLQPKTDLEKAVEKSDLGPDDFITLRHGEVLDLRLSASDADSAIN